MTLLNPYLNSWKKLQTYINLELGLTWLSLCWLFKTLHKFSTEVKSILKENAETNSAWQQQNEWAKVGGNSSKFSGFASRKKKQAKFLVTDDKNEDNVQLICKCCGLVETLVKCFYLDEEEKESWHRGLIQAMPWKDRFQV